MEKVKVTANQRLNGSYGDAFAGDEIELPRKDAERLAKAGVVTMEGVEADGKTPAPKGTSLVSKATTHEDTAKVVEPVKETKVATTATKTAAPVKQTAAKKTPAKLTKK